MEHILIAIWFVVQTSCNDSRICMQKSTAVAMQEFKTKATCDAAAATIGTKPGLLLVCVPK